MVDCRICRILHCQLTEMNDGIMNFKQYYILIHIMIVKYVYMIISINVYIYVYKYAIFDGH